jgi:cytochrome P450
MTNLLNSDLLSDEATTNPYAVFRRLREYDPIVWSPRHLAWIITGHAELGEAFKDLRLSTAQLQGFRDRLPPQRREALELAMRLLDGWMLFHEPPTHTRLREPLKRRFTPKALASLTNDVRTITSKLLDEMEEAGEFDLVEAFAHPLPANVIGRLFGVPDELRGWLGAWSAKFGKVVFGATKDPDYLRCAHESGEEFHRIVGDLMAQYTRQPTDNLISALLAYRDDIHGENGLSSAEILGTCSALLFAGHDTTTSLLGSGTVALLEQTQSLEWLRAQPGDELPDAAIEELLRFESPAKTMIRTVAESHERNGHRFEAGQRVFMAIGAANRDPLAFTNPDTLDLERDPNPHFTFGYGRHFCLGAYLARLEIRTAMRMLIDRFPHLHITGPVEWRATISDRSAKRIPVSVRAK